LHIYSLGGRNPYARDSWRWTLAGVVIAPASRGYVRLTGPRCGDRLLIDHRYLSDSEGRDLDRLVEATLRAREAARTPPLADLLGEELVPGPDVEGMEAMRRFATQSTVHYFHPAGSCKMGPDSDPLAV